MLIGLGYRKQSGKDTVAHYLAEHYGFHQIAFADNVKKAAMTVFGFTHDQMYGTEQEKSKVDPRWSMTPRYAMQTLGATMRNVFSQDIWVKSVELSIAQLRGQLVVADAQRPDQNQLIGEVNRPNTERGIAFCFEQQFQNIVVSDVRYRNEADMIRRLGGVLIRVDRPSLGENQDTHESEIDLVDYDFDYVILNDGDVGSLNQKVDRFCLEYVNEG